MGPHVNERFQPLVFHRQRIDLNDIVSHGAPMLRDVRSHAPEPCTSCPHLEAARDVANYQMVLGCKNVAECPVIEEVSSGPPSENMHFLDYAPTLFMVPSNCASCAYAAQGIDGWGRTIYHCNRREAQVEHCIVRGSMTPLEWEAAEYETRRLEEENAERELDSELNLLMLQDEKDFGTF